MTKASEFLRAQRGIDKLRKQVSKYENIDDCVMEFQNFCDLLAEYPLPSDHVNEVSKSINKWLTDVHNMYAVVLKMEKHLKKLPYLAFAVSKEKKP